MNITTTLLRRSLCLLAALLATAALADEAQIRKNISQRMPEFPKIDEVTKTDIPGLYELRAGTDVLYADENGDHIIEGHILQTQGKRDLTQARIDKLTAIDVAALPLKDAVLIKQGSGARKLVVFADPNCGYCKRIEKDLATMKDVSIYTFLYPILGPDSNVKSRDIWCAKDPGQAWRAWMVSGVAPTRSMGRCDTAALDRNLQLGHKHRINGTPAVVFSDGSRAPGAIPLEEIEQRMAAAAKKS